MRGPSEKCPRCANVANVGWMYDQESIGCCRCGWTWKKLPGAQLEMFEDRDLSWIGDKFDPEWQRLFNLKSGEKVRR